MNITMPVMTMTRVEDGGGKLQVVINVFSLLGPISLKIEVDPGLGKPHTIQ